MGRRYIHIFCGAGMGKTSAALGKGVRAASEGKSVVVIQFLKEKKTENVEEFFKRLEPEIRLFRFEKFPEEYESLTEREKEEENLNIKNGLNFARKVLQTEECDVLILDEVLSVGDAAFRAKSERRLQGMMGDGVTVLFVSHSTDRVQNICNKAIILTQGQLVAEGDADEMCRIYGQMVKQR